MDVAEVREGMNPQNRTMFFLGRYLPPLLRWSVRRISKQLLVHSGPLLERMMAQLPDVDREILSVPKNRAHFLAVVRSAFRKGELGGVEDLVLVSRPWGFDLRQVPMVVNLWFGGKDVIAPPAAGRYLARALERSEARYYPDEGHLSLIWNRFEEILTGLLATADREAGRPVG
jgi:pimeloyl-ACP methyl ester carboxylesterase